MNLKARIYFLLAVCCYTGAVAILFTVQDSLVPALLLIVIGNQYAQVPIEI